MDYEYNVLKMGPCHEEILSYFFQSSQNYPLISLYLAIGFNIENIVQGLPRTYNPTKIFTI